MQLSGEEDIVRWAQPAGADERAEAIKLLM